MDTIHRLLESSDPLISLSRELPKKKKFKRDAEMFKLLIIDESEDTVSDSNEEENESIHSNSSL